MDISTIHTKKDYKAAIARIELLIDAESNTPEGDELEILATLVHAYEEINHPIDAPDPIEFIKNVMEFRGYDQKDLADLLNSRPRASELLKKLRPLSLKQIRLISGAWDIPVEPLIQEYKLQA
ncbi:MAG: hypothetical protein HOF74_12870 [Gammaproteobacteria bacterium]|jgi:HTH-type transcriptional regulator/antitoxin HigA|nr:hypothetical protein [Gammaproteobacteria bacterium]MBT3860717.1 hypothetical protein [Gammaproteobacteria bacterium]MBT3988124.1 hypothetical protein [Gammaproteobacteria bacterium]MBT4255520.1 hypothetical protein [Gammaproteobacteria bacterium]MBT4583411.1 hypothetical protein [Gammaproteobacteria bacterium]